MAQPKQPTIAEIVSALGGVLPTAYKAGVSIPTVYAWKRAGCVFQAIHAVRLAQVAKDHGVHVTVEQLAAAPSANGDPERTRHPQDARSRPAPAAARDERREVGGPTAQAPEQARSRGTRSRQANHLTTIRRAA